MSIPFIDLKSQQARIRDKIDAGLAAVLDHAHIMGLKSRHLRKGLPNGLEPNTIFLFLGNGCAAACVAGARPETWPGCHRFLLTFAASAEVMPVMGAIPVFARC